MPIQPCGSPTSRKTLELAHNIVILSLQDFLTDKRTMLIKLICAVVALSAMTLATASNISIATLTDMPRNGSSGTKSHAGDMAGFLAAVTNAIDNADDQGHSDPDNLHQKHIGLGFGLSMNVGNPHNGECNSNGHRGDINDSAHEIHGNVFDHRNCGDPSPSE
jgi:hypothetical protein